MKVLKPKLYVEKCFNQNFWLFIGWDRDKFVDYCRIHYGISMDYIPPTATGAARLAHSLSGNRLNLIWTKHKPNSPQRIGTVAHECLHAVGNVFNLIGVKYDQQNDEPYAYLLSRLVQECLE